MQKLTTRFLCRSYWTVVLVAAGQTPCFAQSSTGAGAGELETITVTGSRIPQRSQEGPAPVFVLTGEQLAAQGFVTVADALKSLSQVTGVTQNDQFAGGFTQNASAINLRGLGPGRTLILLDGRRITDYALPYDGKSNFVNVAALPAVAIERIEVLSGGSSAIYGSDAVAGVVNIIMRKDVPTSLEITARVGNTTQGGGESKTLQLLGGYNQGAFKLSYAAEYSERDPIYGFERDFMDSLQDNPNAAARLPARAVLRGSYIPATGAQPYIDPGAAACAAFGLERSFRPGRGYYCGQSDYDAQQTVRNGRKQGSLYSYAEWDLGSTELFGSVVYVQSRGELDDNRANYWSPDLLYNVANGQFEDLQRFFMPFEAGGRDARFNKYDEKSWNLYAGARGDLSAGWKYEASINQSRYTLEKKARRLLFNNVENYFLGPVLGTDPVYRFFNAYNFNVARYYTPLTPEIYNNQLSAIDTDRGSSSYTTADFVVNGELLQLPAGPLAVAGVLEWGSQRYDVTLDPRLVAGDFAPLVGSGGRGKRDRYAAGAELSIPLVASLRASLAGRYDKYDDSTRLDDALTYKAGLEYRPVQPLLLRGTVSSSFRAPDMQYVFADPNGFYEGVTDYYLCRRYEPGTPIASCNNAGVTKQGASRGNPNLKEETGKSFTLGFVLEPVSELRFSMDYYHIDLDGLVVDYPADRILRLEADCRLGRTASGAAVNTGSAECQDALARVRRNPASGIPTASEQIQFITTGPINTAQYYTSGFDATLAYKFPQTALGRFGFETTYTHVLKFETQDFAGDPVKNIRDFPTWPQFHLRSHVRSSVSWEYRQLQSTLFMERLGSIPNYVGTDRIKAQTYFNWSAKYRFLDERASVGLLVDNLLDRNPPRDPTYDVWPYYSTFNYSPVGREWFLQLGYRFE